MIEKINPFVSAGIVNTTGDTKSSLTYGGQHKSLIKDLTHHRLAAEAAEAGESQNNAIKLAIGEFAKPGIDISTQVEDLHGRESMPQLDLSSKAARTDARCRRKRINLAPVRDQSIPRIFALGNSPKTDTLRQLEGDILHAVHGGINPTVKQRFIYFFCKQSLTADF
jgi:hypothetical protein